LLFNACTNSLSLLCFFISASSAEFVGEFEYQTLVSHCWFVVYRSMKPHCNWGPKHSSVICGQTVRAEGSIGATGGQWRPLGPLAVWPHLKKLISNPQILPKSLISLRICFWNYLPFHSSSTELITLTQTPVLLFNVLAGANALQFHQH